MVGNTIQEKFEMIKDAMKAKLSLIESYMDNEMESFAKLEIESLKRYLELQMDNIAELLPAKAI